MLLNKNYCLICGEKLEEKINIPDPKSRFYKCGNCGYYLPLEEFDGLARTRLLTTKRRPELIQTIENIKKENPYFYDNFLFVIGTRDEINGFNYSDLKRTLIDRKFKIHYIEFSFINDWE